MKKYLLGIFAVVIALGLSAFTAKKTDGNFTNKYFKYLDYPNDANINMPSRYELSIDLGCPDVAAHRCAVIAPSDNGSPERPVLTDPSVIVKKKN